MTTETFRRADHRPVPTSAHEAEASAVARVGSLRGLSLVLFSLGHNSFSFSQKAVQRNRGARELLRQAMARTQTWTAPPREVERARTRQIAHIGSNLNQIARWAHTHVDEDLAVVEVLAHLIAIEREVAALRVRGAGDAD